MNSEQKLITLLQNAHAGELAAYYAYDGHQISVNDPAEKAEILKIRDEEWEHRECVASMLKALGASPRPRRELMMKCVGLTIGFLCRIGGWVIPMYGAGKLESGNIVEYEVAADLAVDCGRFEFVEDLVRMAEVEWDHELYFRKKYQSHLLHFVFPKWPLPAAKQLIRKNRKISLPISGTIDVDDSSTSNRIPQ